MSLVPVLFRVCPNDSTICFFFHSRALPTFRPLHFQIRSFYTHFFQNFNKRKKNRQTILVYLSSASRVGLEMPGVRNSNLIMAMKFYISLTRLVSRNHFMRKYKSGKYAFWLNIVKVQEHARVAAVSYSFCFLMS